MGEEIDILATVFGVNVPPECRAGVAANFAILAGHMQIVEAAAEDAPVDPAELLTP